MEKIKKNRWFFTSLFLIAMIFVFILGFLMSSIIERRAESLIAYTPAKDLDLYEPDNEKWGDYFPLEYETWKRTSETDFKSKYNGNATIDMLAQDPRLVLLWAGYGFAKDYEQGRGHYYAVQDIRRTLRTGAPVNHKNNTMPNTCWTCKSSDVPRLIDEMGSEAFYKGAWSMHGDKVYHPIGCVDCHDPKTMKLRISRPALKEAFHRKNENVQQAKHQEMRTLACAQCHVEYYFEREGNYLTFPWDNGMTVEQMEVYYDSLQFSDWTHKLSKAPMLKAQHPDYELFNTGIHARRGLACADCHMPYKSEGGIKFTSHHVVSPLLHVDETCQVCHRQNEQEMRKTVYERQDKNYEIRIKAEDLIVHAHIEAKKAWELGASPKEMSQILRLIRHAQWRWDFVAASHGASFHSPLESARILSTAIEKAQSARLKLARLLASKGYNNPVPVPDITTKAKVQSYVELDMIRLHKEKEWFLETVVSLWEENYLKKNE